MTRHTKVVGLHTGVSIITVILLVLFFLKLVDTYTGEIDSKLSSLNKPTVEELCNISGCKKIYYDETLYSKQHYNLVETPFELPPKSIYQLTFAYISEDFKLIMPYHTDIKKPIHYIDLNIDKFIDDLEFLIIFSILLANGILFAIGLFNLSNLQLLNNVLHSRDKMALQFDNLLFYFENLNHEVNNPLFLLKKKINRLNNGEPDTVIDNSIALINSLMDSVKYIKRINLVSEDKCIYSLIEETIQSILVLRAEHFEYKIDDKFKDYQLNQEKIPNGIFINLLTAHIRNSIEAYADNITITIQKNNKNYITFDIKDNGNGIEKENISKVFVKGFSTKAITKKNNFSGLYTIREVLRRAGGDDIILGSEVGETIFRLDIPIIQHHQ